jgi:hypothetical protein
LKKYGKKSTRKKSKGKNHGGEIAKNYGKKNEKVRGKNTGKIYGGKSRDFR